MPITVRLVWHVTSLGRVGQAAFLAITVRYGAIRTVSVVVTYAELAQSYQYHALWWAVSLVRLVPTGESTALVMGAAFHSQDRSPRVFDLWRPCSAGDRVGGRAFQLANSQCHGSGIVPDGSSHAGWNHPYSGAFCCIHRCAGAAKLWTPPQRSTARPSPCWLVPGVAASLGDASLTAICSARGR